MKKFNLVKGISTALVAVSLVAGFVIPSNAAKADDVKLSQKEVTQMGAPAAPTISLKEQRGSGQVVTSWTLTLPAVPKGYRLYLNVYQNNNPFDSEVGSWSKDDKGRYEFTPGRQWGSDQYDVAGQDWSMDRSDFTLGDKTVVAYYFDSAGYDTAHKAAYEAWYAACEAKYDAAYDAWSAGTGPMPKWNNYFNEDTIPYPAKADFMSPASNPIKISVDSEASVSAVVKSTSITLDMYAYGATGFEVYRKVGSKYKKIATVAKNTYADKGLTSKTKYSYKVRPYYKNMDTNKTVYGKYTQIDRSTKGSVLNLKLTVSGTKNVKLSWKKVNGVTKYEVYRYAGSSDETVISKGIDDYYSSWELIKTLKKNQKSYTDKKTAANQRYSYLVRAVLPADKKVKGDKVTYIEESRSVNFAFGSPDVYASYEDAYGNKTIQWKKGYGIDGYIVEQYKQGADGKKEWVEIKRLGKTVTSYKFAAASMRNQDGTWETEVEYRICAYKGKTKSDYRNYSTTKLLGLVNSVTAKKVANGVQVSWSPVAGAAYYRVYRVKADSLVKNNDIGGYANMGGTRVTEYVGAQNPVRVDVAAWNASVNAWINDTTGTVAKPLITSSLDEKETYYYRNYQYARDTFDAPTTSILDYSGEIYRGSIDYSTDSNGNEVYYAHPHKYNSNANYTVGPQKGVSYQYYVIAYKADEYTLADYTKANEGQGYTPEELAQEYNDYISTIVVTPGTINASKTAVQKKWKTYSENTVGCKKISSEVSYTTVKAPAGKATIKSIKAGKKSATIKLKKKVKGATAYKVYRSTKKKGTFLCVGIMTKTAYKDSGLQSGKTYYYKIVPIATSESGADIAGKASKVKSVKAK